jgi:predicted DNA-binding transcriptional regulator AlpA
MKAVQPTTEPAKAAQSLPAEGYVRVARLAAFFDVDPATIWRWAQQKRFPQPYRITDAVTAWKAEEINQWCAENITALTDRKAVRKKARPAP